MSPLSYVIHERVRVCSHFSLVYSEIAQLSRREKQKKQHKRTAAHGVLHEFDKETFNSREDL